uniref:Myb-like domain-containing protein n=1 Tax=Neogobius melanostomus TaxID=47308 RepID=A0A8C6WRQ4_9GOBI
MNTKKNKQKVSKAKPGKVSQPPAYSHPPVETSSSSQPLSRRQEKDFFLKKTGGKRTEEKTQMDLRCRSSCSSNSSLERESHSQKSQKKRSKTNQKPQSNTPSPQPAQIATRTTAQSNRTRKRTAHNKQSSELDDDAWTEEELRKLQEAVSCHPQHVTGYWTKVAVMVGTRSADECHKRYTCQWASKTPAKRESKAKPKAPSREKVDNPVISARVGTLRRKQQVRDFLEAMPKEDMDDVFSSAYMQNKRFEVPSMCPSDDHDFSMSDPEPLTPRHTGFPEAKTPQCLHITPNMMGSSSRCLQYRLFLWY